MQTKLKDAIIAQVQANANEFQLQNYIIDCFRKYIYTPDGYNKGNYLIGGEEVANFISDFINLYTK